MVAATAALGAGVDQGHSPYHHDTFFKTTAKYLKRPRSQEMLLRCTSLLCIYVLAFSVRLVRGVARSPAISCWTKAAQAVSTTQLANEAKAMLMFVLGQGP
jgi:hypothetical protein